MAHGTPLGVNTFATSPVSRKHTNTDNVMCLLAGLMNDDDAVRKSLVKLNMSVKRDFVSDVYSRCVMMTSGKK